MAASGSAQQPFASDAARRRLKRRRPRLQPPDGEPGPWTEGWRRSPVPQRGPWGPRDEAWAGGVGPPPEGDGAALWPSPPLLPLPQAPPPLGRGGARAPPEGSDRWGSPPREGRWDRPGSRQVRNRKNRWGSPMREPPEGWAQSPPDLRGGRWSSPEGRGGEQPHQPPPLPLLPHGRRRSMGLGSPERMRRPQGPNGDSRGWGSPQREAREQPLEDLRGGRWSSPERMRRPQGPNGDPRGWGSPQSETGKQPPEELQGGWWSNPERRAIEQQPLPHSRRRPMGPGSPKRMRRLQSPNGHSRGWGSPQRENLPQDLRGGLWSSPERQGSEQQHQQASGRRRMVPGIPEGMRRQESPNGHPRDWGDPKWEPRQEFPQGQNHPGWEQFQGNPSGGGGRWSSPEKRGGEQQPPHRRQLVGPGSPERLRRQPGPSSDPRDWGDPEGPKSRGRPVREWLQGNPGGSWSSLEGRGGDRQSPARGEGSWGSASRRRESPPGEQRVWGSPTQGEGQECFGSPRHFDSEQGPADWAGSRWSGLKQREAEAPVLSRGGSPRNSDRPQSSSGGQQRWSRPTLFRGGWDPDKAGTESCGRGGKEGDDSDGDKRSPKRSGSPAELATGIPAAPLERWTPREQVVQYWMQCQAVLKKRMRRQLLSVCPQPALPNRMSEVPCLNADITHLLNAKDIRELRAASRPLWGLQEELLEMLGPAMTIYEMAEEAMENEAAVDAMELREWSRCLIRYIGSINQRITVQRCMQVLGTISPQLKCATSKMISQSTDGKLFAEDKVQLLKEIIQRFPQLTETKKKVFPRKYQPFSKRPQNVAAFRQRRFPLGPHSHPWNSGAQAQGQSPADRRVNQDHH